MKKFSVHDQVYVKGYGDIKFVVVGYEYKESYINKRIEKDCRYYVYSAHFSEDMVAFEEDMTIYKRANYYKKNEDFLTIDDYLDDYIKQMTMFEVTEDEQYLKNAKMIEKQLESLSPDNYTK